MGRTPVAGRMEESVNSTLLLCFGGMKHCGKSTHASRFASRFHFPYDDLDRLIETDYQSACPSDRPLSCRGIYRKEGPAAFIQLETAALRRWIAAQRDPKITAPLAVLSLGGGIASNPEAMRLLDREALLLYLRQEEETLFKRIAQHELPPFLQTDDPRAAFHRLFCKRDPIYARHAKWIISLKEAPREQTFRQICDTIKAPLAQLGVKL